MADGWIDMLSIGYSYDIFMMESLLLGRIASGQFFAGRSRKIVLGVYITQPT